MSEEESRDLYWSDVCMMGYQGQGGVGNTTSGQWINGSTALMASPVWQAVSLISGDIARAPLITYEQRQDGGRVRALNNPGFNLLRRYTGQYTANKWLSRVMTQALLYGNAYTQIMYDRGRPSSLLWLSEDRVTPDISNGVMFYRVQYDQQLHGRADLVRVPESDMIHIEGLSVSELCGLPLVYYARNAIGMYNAAEQYTAEFFKNGAVPLGFFEYPGNYDDAKFSKWLTRYRQEYTANADRHGTPILPNGMKWTAAGVSPADAMVIDQLTFTKEDVASFFNLPKSKLGIKDSVSYNSAEEESLSYLNSTLGPWMDGIENEVTHKLYGESQYFCEFLQEALQKANIKTKTESYRTAITTGWMNRNEVRLRENMNPFEGGEEFLVPLNMEVVGDEEDIDSVDSPARSELIDLIEDGLQKCCRALRGKTKRSAKTATLYSILNEFGDKFRDPFRQEVYHGVRTAIKVLGVNRDAMADAEAIALELIGGFAAEVIDATKQCQSDNREDVVKVVAEICDRPFPLARDIASRFISDLEGSTKCEVVQNEPVALNCEPQKMIQG